MRLRVAVMLKVPVRVVLGGVGACVCLLALPSLEAATTVYKWVDAEGSTHYSEAPPVAAFSSVEIMELVPVASPGSERPDYRSTLEIANSMQADRLARERLRLEQLQLQQAIAAEQKRQYASQQEVTSGGPYYGYPYFPYAPLPPYPGPRPPYLPPGGGHFPPMYPAGPGAIPKRVYLGP
jgi:hypothetical protein